MSETKTSMKERLKSASGGCYINPYVLLPKLEAAAAWPLDELLDADTLESLEDTRISLSISDPFEIYQDAVNLISKYWQDPTDPENHNLCSRCREYVGYIQNLIIAFANCYINELRRRNNAEAYIHVKNAACFPGFSIPLPRLLQAGALRCPDTSLSQKLSGIYQNEFLALLDENPSLKKTTANYLDKQPVSRYFYDPVIMTFATAHAASNNMIRAEEALRYYFDIFILPYVVQKTSDETSGTGLNHPDQADHPDEGFIEADSSPKLYIENEEEASFTGSDHLENYINDLCRTELCCKYANHKTYDNWILYYPMTDTPYPFCGEEDWREELRDTLSNIIKIVLCGDMNTELEETDVQNHLFSFLAYAVDENGDAVDYDFTKEDMEILIDDFNLNCEAEIVALVCHKDEKDCMQHIHGLFYFRPNEPWHGMTRIEEILS